jgi:parvulin-like peptidyl-prolyl isomerase
MKKLFAWIIPVLLLAGCAKKMPFAKDTVQYAFFKTLSETVPVMNPDTRIELVKTSKFKLYSTDLMPLLYRGMSGMAGNLKNIPPEQLVQFVHQQAQGEAEKRMLALSAGENGVRIPDDSVKAVSERFYKNMGGKEAFLKQIGEDGFSEPRFIDEIRSNLTIQKYLEETIEKKTVVSDSEIQAAYGGDRLATVRHILLSTQGKSPAQKADIRKKLDGILARIRKGEDFGKLAKQYTEDPGSKARGGLYENFERGAMVPAFDSLAFSLPIGGLSDVFETPYGFHIMKVINRGGESKPLAAVKERLQRELTGKKQRAAYQQLLDTLKLKYQYQEIWKGV